jgi:hypothetical protein
VLSHRFLFAAARLNGEEQKWLRSQRRSRLVTHAALLHRAGRPGEAIRRLRIAMKLSPDGQGEPLEWLWLALAHAASTKAPHPEALHWLEKAERAQPKRDGAELWDAVQWEVLLAEARRSVRLYSRGD